MKTFLSRFIVGQSGSTAIEYGLIAALIAVVLIGSVSVLRDKISGIYTEIATAMPVD